MQTTKLFSQIRSCRHPTRKVSALTTKKFLLVRSRRDLDRTPSMLVTKLFSQVRSCRDLIRTPAVQTRNAPYLRRTVCPQPGNQEENAIDSSLHTNQENSSPRRSPPTAKVGTQEKGLLLFITGHSLRFVCRYSLSILHQTPIC